MRVSVARIDRRRRLVEDEARRVGHVGAGERDELALAGRQVLAPLADPRGQAVGRGRRARSSRPSSTKAEPHRGVGGLRPAEADVLQDRGVEQERAPAAPSPGVDRSDAVDTSRRSMPAMPDHTVVGIGEAGQELGQRRLARAGGADHGHRRGRLDGEHHVAQRGRVVGGVLARARAVGEVTWSTLDRRGTGRQLLTPSAGRWISIGARGWRAPGASRRPPSGSGRGSR